MPKGTPKYFEQMDPWGEQTSTDSPEFLAKVRAKIGDPYKDLVQPGMFQNSRDKNWASTLAGINLSAVPMEKRIAAGREIGLGAIDPNKPYIGVGAGASPATFAHEARHDKFRNELNNRLQDLYYSDSLPQYAANIQSAYEDMRNDMGGRKTKNIPFREKEKYVLNMATIALSNTKSGIDIDKHVNINTDPNVDPMTMLSKKAVKDRVAYPFLNFVGDPNLPDADKVKQESIDIHGKAKGGFIENTTHDRKII